MELLGIYSPKAGFVVFLVQGQECQRKGKAFLGLLLIMMEPVEETYIPLLSFNSNFLYLILICHILCRQIGRLNCSCVSLAIFYSCTLSHFSVYLKLTALNSVEFLNAHPSQTPTLFYTYIILHFKFLSLGALKVGFCMSGSSALWGKYKGIALPLSDTDNSSFLSDKDF